MTPRINKKAISTAIAFSIIVAFGFIPAPNGVSTDGMRVLGIFIGCMLLWITVSVDWPSLLCILALCTVRSISTENVLIMGFGTWVFPFLLSSFALSYALSQTQFIKRCTLLFITNYFARKCSWNFVILFYAAVLLVGLFTTSSVLFIMFLPILESIIQDIGFSREDKAAKVLVAGLAIVCSVAGMTTPIAHPWPVLAITYLSRDAGIEINYINYTIFGLTTGLVIVMIMLLGFRYVLKLDLSKVKDYKATSIRKSLCKADFGEKCILVVWGIVIFLWIAPSVFEKALPNASAVLADLTNAFPPILGLLLLCLLRKDGVAVVELPVILKKGVPWAMLIMVAAVLALGGSMTEDELGLVSFISEKYTGLPVSISPIILLIIFVGSCLFLTNFSANIVALTLIYSIAVPAAITSKVLNPAILTCLLGASASLAFATPTATAHIAVACGTQWVSIRYMLKFGFVMMIVSTVVLILVGYPLLSILV